MSWLRVLAFVGLIALVYLVQPRRVGAPHEASEPGASGAKIQVGADNELELRAETTAIPGGRRLSLSSPNGTVDLVLVDAKTSGPFTFGDGRFEQGSGERGAGFVADVAAWLDRPAPPRRRGQLATLPFTYAGLGDRDGWEANKLFLQFGPYEAEIYLNLAPDGRRARLLEKDPEYAPGLLAVLAVAVRDGIPPRRSTRNDEHMASDEPWFANLVRLDAPGRVDSCIWSPAGFLGVVDNRHIVLWEGPEAKAKPMGTAAGIVTALVPAPDDARVAVLVVHPRHEGSYSSDDPTELLIFEPGEKPRSLARSEVAFKLMSHTAVVWSPNGSRVAVSAPSGEHVPRKKVVRIIDARSGKVLAATEKALDVEPTAWSAQGLALVRRDYAGATPVETRYLWDAANGAPRRVPAAGIASPDGRFVVSGSEEGVLAVRGPNGSRTFASASTEDRAVVKLLDQYPQVWCGPHHLVLGADDPVVLDLAALTVRLLFPARRWILLSASPDGRSALCRSPDGEPYWGRAGP